jgi:hypothetical protein
MLERHRMDEQNEKIEPETEALDFSKPDFSFTPREYHDWRQSGPYLVCKGCELEHGIFIGVEKILTGVTDKGLPILKSRKELGMS